MKKELKRKLNEDMDVMEGDVELSIPEELGKDLKKEIRSIKNASKQEIRHLVDNFYQIQQKRIMLQGQIRAIRQDTDDTTESFASILEWQLKTQMIQEKGLKDALQCITQSNKVGKWLMSIKGIGPTLAAGLMAYFDVTGINYATHFISYAGLNDNNRPWLGSEASRKIVEEVLGDSKSITDEHLETLSAKTKWSYKYLNENCSTFDEDGNVKSRSKTKLINSIAKIPYNKNLKVLMFKIAESFVKNSNRGSLYGELYRQRKVQETKLNEKLHYKDQAAHILATKNFSKDTDAYKAYIQGKLPAAHIDARAKRWAIKIFVSHVFEEMYRVQNNKEPEPFYVFTHLGHKDYIKPEVAFDEVE